MLILVSIFVYKNFDFISEITFKVAHPPPATIPTGPAVPAPRVDRCNDSFPDITVELVQLVPVDFDLPSSFYAELRNQGLAAGGAEVLIDLGSANIVDYEIRPSEAAQIVRGGEGKTF